MSEPIEAFEPSVVPDVGLAIARQLQAAAALVGKERVVQFFRNATKQIVNHRWPIDAGGIVNGKCQDDMAELIKQLLSQ